jgi:hypothetical protein
MEEHWRIRTHPSEKQRSRAGHTVCWSILSLVMVKEQELPGMRGKEWGKL